MTLSDYLDAAREQRWQWGVVDCSLFASDWVRMVTGKDPAEGLRGTYSTQDEARAVIAREGGFVPMVRERFERCGLADTFDPQDGDVGIIRVPVGGFQDEMPVVGAILGIRHCGLWVAKAAYGIRAGEFPHLFAWRV